PRPRPSPGYRMIWVKPVRRIDQAVGALQAWKGRMESIGLALSDTEAIRPRLRSLGASRLCHIGEMQTPPLRWRLIDQGLLKHLLAWTTKPDF
ncbi:MAG: acyl-CoA reductase, partial [Nitrospirota bacterium]